MRHNKTIVYGHELTVKVDPWWMQVQIFLLFFIAPNVLLFLIR